ncbi:GTPase RsgA [Micromonospora sp. WMMA1923]|uniref:GTPase RsgA n=1 Tax=Micromonospora sp. WMMA1923 TaxID=3404125 RepID=UPI003B93F836
MSLAELGWDDERDRAFAALRNAGRTPARVARVDRGTALLYAAAGPVRARIVDGRHRSAAPAVVTGDWVALRAGEPPTVDVLLDRRGTVRRPASGGGVPDQVLGTNIDVLAVVEALDPAPEALRVGRLLTLAWQSGAVPVLVLTMADRVADPAAVARQLADDAPGVPVHPVDATDPAQVAVLRRYLSGGRTLGLVGAPGVGKSLLAATLAASATTDGRAATTDSRATPDDDGRAATPGGGRVLVRVPSGGCVLDTPGLAGTGLLGAAEAVDRTFADVVALAAECRFPDCAHLTEPGCAVLAAIDDGVLPAQRLANWQRLGREIDWETRPQEARIASAARWEQRRAQRRARG